MVSRLAKDLCPFGQGTRQRGVVGQAGPGCSMHPSLLLMEPGPPGVLGPPGSPLPQGPESARPCGPTYGVKLVLAAGPLLPPHSFLSGALCLLQELT